MPMPEQVGMPYSKGADEVHVDEHRLVVALLREAQLLLETLQLVDRVVQFRVGVAELLAVDEQLETLRKIPVVAVALAQGDISMGVVADERRLDEVALTVLAEDGVDEFALAHRVVDLDIEAFAGLAQLLLRLSRDVVAGLLADGVGHRQAAERRLERDRAAVDLDLRGAVHGRRDPLRSCSVNSIIQR